METEERDIAPDRSSSECVPMMESAGLHIYCDNPFRVTGLAVDASAKEIKRQADKLKGMEELGYGEVANKAAFTLNPPPSIDKIRTAMQRLNDPEFRLVDEFFWFWPQEFGRSGSDPAILSLLAGDSDTAYDIWSRLETHRELGYVAEHNIAVMFHLIALDWTIYHLAADIDSAREAKIMTYWDQAILRWEKVAADERVWDAMKGRIRSMDDARLTTGFARRMCASLPDALDKINAHAALRFAEDRGRFDVAKKHVEFMRRTHQGLDNVEKTTEMVLRPIRSRIQQQIKTAREAIKSKPESGAEQATQLMEHCLPLSEIFELFHDNTAHQKTELFDEVVEASVDFLVVFQKNTGDNKRFVELLRHARTLASGSDIQKRIENNIKIGEGNISEEALEPILKRLGAIQQKNDVAALQFASVKSYIIPYLETCSNQNGVSDGMAMQLSNAVASALRGISIKAHNEDKDCNTALASLKLAAKLAKDPVLQLRIDDDLKIVEETFRASTCYFCTRNLARSGSEKKVNMYGNVWRTGGTIHYNHNSVSVPRCKKCQSLDIKHTLIAAAVWIACVLICIAYFEISTPGAWMAGVISGIPLGFPIAWIAKSIIAYNSGVPSYKKYAKILELQSMGWRFGSKPSNYG
jgi:hypothetical protein